jgi:hypothetical protein
MAAARVPLDRLIATKLPWLFADLGFRVACFEYSPKVFGDAVLTLYSEALLLRFVLDRGRIFAELAPPSEPDQWWGLEFVCEAILGEQPVPELDGLAELLRRNYLAIVEALGPNLPETREALDRVFNRRAQIKVPLAPLHVRLRHRFRRALATRAASLLGLVLAAFAIWWIISR